jgi:hypothetical protein
VAVAVKRCGEEGEGEEEGGGGAHLSEETGSLRGVQRPALVLVVPDSARTSRATEAVT